MIEAAYRMQVKLDRQSALIIVDVQNDFCPGGSLPVKDGDKVVPVLNRYSEMFVKADASIFATRDWHPSNHISFKARGGVWPTHCVQGTSGAEFHPDLRLPRDVIVISKGFDPDEEAYSGFQGTSLEQMLRDRGVNVVFIGGLATDYCVKNTALGALKAGFEVFLLEDACRGVDVNLGDSERAVQELVGKGAFKMVLTRLSV